MVGLRPECFILWSLWLARRLSKGLLAGSGLRSLRSGGQMGSKYDNYATGSVREDNPRLRHVVREYELVEALK